MVSQLNVIPCFDCLPIALLKDIVICFILNDLSLIMHLSNEQRLLALGRLQGGDTVANVANIFGVTPRTIRRLRAKYATTGSTADLPRSGRPRETTLRQDRHIVLTHLRNRFTGPHNTALNTPGRTRPHVSARTVRRRLRVAGVRC